MLDRIENGLVAANRWLLIVMLIAMACIVFANVVLRYATDDSIIWAEEVARHLMIWGTFLGAGLVLRYGGHVAIDSLHHAVGNKGAQVLRGIVAFLIGAFCLVMTVASMNYTWFMRFQTTSTTDISFAWIYAALPVGFFLTFIHLLFVVRRYVLEGRYMDSPEMDAESAASL
ncbi:TRAP transporter small permease [Pigmentiphaga aceris]|uniref:TRAP transporter small permease protein n=1 Tax=Pigmentiphaga aceris TaxID=1940612 RepID=A0A5C0B079_9BURK|nr:TRAP transporter small permease [Pigmentiphaga aceris]QEI07775.1 TRAP transporter small permease [Pigmentiphaga aceris]